MGLISGDFDLKVTHMIGHLLDLLLQKLLCGRGIQTVIRNRGNQDKVDGIGYASIVLGQLRVGG